MPGFRFVKCYDIKSPDGYMLRSKVQEWVEHRFQMLEKAHRELKDWVPPEECPPEEKARCRTVWNSYHNNFDLLEHAIRFMCEVDLMSERTGKEYVEKMYKFVLEDIEDYRERKRRKE